VARFTLTHVSDHDRRRWDERYESRGPVSLDEVTLPPVFEAFADVFPTSGQALDIACGRGTAAVWLARRGMTVSGLDVSAVAIAQATDLALASGVAPRCRFVVADLDAGLPPGPPADVVLCHMFRDSRLDDDIIARLAPGGLLGISALSDVGAAPGPFRVEAGELRQAFATLDVIAAGEGDGEAWLLARG
jgi:2-polyprenyl-3-methyl-5-hydroxy-6-metoxy-1,4-benzoquinol methylase